tara:strand:- start:425 stop:655 length:231 start_codon:yes stop_codon:yes gene_type:complete
VIIGLPHIDTIVVMDNPENHIFNFQIDAPALKLLVKGMRHYLEKWPGGDANEQIAIQNMLFELNKAHLELVFIEDE